MRRRNIPMLAFQGNQRGLQTSFQMIAQHLAEPFEREFSDLQVLSSRPIFMSIMRS